jgi:preprotein translocase subunit YajC
MDFIERLFGLAPDNGDGSTEILWLVVLAVVIASFVYFRIQRRKTRR